MRIIYTTETENYLVDLAWILYKKQYFSYFHLAENYIRSLIRDMETTIHIKQKHKAPARFLRYGKDMYYVSYPKKQTNYLVFLFHLGRQPENRCNILTHGVVRYAYSAMGWIELPLKGVMITIHSYN